MIRRFKLGKYHGFSIHIGIFKFERIWFEHKAFMWRFEIAHGWNR